MHTGTTLYSSIGMVYTVYTMSYACYSIWRYNCIHTGTDMTYIV